MPNQTPDIQIKVGGQVFAAGSRGSQVARWINGPVRFGLFDGALLLGSTFVGQTASGATGTSVRGATGTSVRGATGTSVRGATGTSVRGATGTSVSRSLGR